MKAAVISVGSKNESYGANKLASWLRRQGAEVQETNRIDPLWDRYDLWAFSCVFSWKLPEMARMVQEAKQLQGEVWIGGPAVTFHPDNAQWVYNQTGVAPVIGLDSRFERERVSCGMTYFSRGCPAYTPACGVCPVPQIEGREFRYYHDAPCAKLLLDNNLSALPADYQEHIISRYNSEWKSGCVDANSGFEPHTFTEETLKRWMNFPLQCWRFGYDDLTERDQAIEMMRLLRRHGFSGDKVRVYCLIGNEPISDCHRRLKEIVRHGMHPKPQRLRPLNWRSGPLPVKHDWDEPTLIAFQRFYSLPALWKTVKPHEFFYQGRYPLRH